MNPSKLYNETMRKSPPPYRGILIEFVDILDGTFVIKMYKDNLADFSTPRQQEIIRWADDFSRRMTAGGVPTQYWLAV